MDTCPLFNAKKQQPFLVSSNNLPCNISTTNKRLKPLSKSDLRSSSASTLLRRDSTLQEWRSRLAGWGRFVRLSRQLPTTPLQSLPSTPSTRTCLVCQSTSQQWMLGSPAKTAPFSTPSALSHMQEGSPPCSRLTSPFILLSAHRQSHA